MSTQYRFPSFLIDSHVKIEIDVGIRGSDKLFKPLSSEERSDLLPPKWRGGERSRHLSESSLWVRKAHRQYADQFLYLKGFETTEENKRFMYDKSI